MERNTDQFAELGLEKLMALGEGDEIVGAGAGTTAAVRSAVRSAVDARVALEQGVDGPR